VACRVTNSNRDGSVRDLSNLKRIYVKYVDGEKDSVKNKLGAMGGNIHHEFTELQYFAVSVPANLLSSLEADDAIEYIEDDFLRELIGYDKDNNGLRHLTKQRFLEEATPYGVTMVKAPEAWRLGHSGTGIKICIIDSGVDQSHEDLTVATVDAEGYSGTADGENWNIDSCGHGTHVTGTIAATKGNDLGVVGVSPDVDLFFVKVFAQPRGKCR